MTSDYIKALTHFPSIVMVKPLDETPQQQTPPAEIEIPPVCPSNAVEEPADVKAQEQEKPPKRRRQRNQQKPLLMDVTPADEVEIISLYPSITGKKVYQNPFTRKHAWMETSNIRETEKEAKDHSLLVTYVEKFKNNSRPKKPKKAKKSINVKPQEDDIEVEMWPLILSKTMVKLDELKRIQRPSGRREHRRTVIDCLETPPLSTVKLAWMEMCNVKDTQRKPEMHKTMVVKMGRYTEVAKDMTPPPVTIKQASNKTCNKKVPQRQPQELHIFPPQAKGQMEKRLPESTPNNKVDPKPSPLEKGIQAIAEWRALKKKRQKEKKERKLQEELQRQALYELYFNNPQMKHLVWNHYNRFHTI